MFGWRKRTEGFEWKEYVRTTVLVRRADRQRKLDDARFAALGKMKDARDRKVSAANAVVGRVRRFGRRLRRKSGVYLTSAARIAGTAIWTGLSRTFAALRSLPLPALDLPPWAKSAVDRLHVSMPGLRGFDLKGARSAYAAGLVAVLLAGAGWLAPKTSLLSASPSSPASKPLPSASKDTASVSQNLSANALSGRATAISGDVLRIAGTYVRLKGIDAPEIHQTCIKGNGRTWPCGTAARDALARLMRNKHVDCDPGGTDDAGRSLATCYAAERDLAAELVKSGNVFATGGFFQSYASEESNARVEKAGLWQGEAERPSVWRQRLWDEAKKSAPDGCPIKGLVRGSGRIYAMPWSHDYGNGKVRAVKGERWFCSEEEARAAGFKLSSRS
jgi:endonuclease YncB( thermonuclease family)